MATVTQHLVLYPNTALWKGWLQVDFRADWPRLSGPEPSFNKLFDSLERLAVIGYRAFLQFELQIQPVEMVTA